MNTTTTATPDLVWLLASTAFMAFTCFTLALAVHGIIRVVRRVRNRGMVRCPQNPPYASGNGGEA